MRQAEPIRHGINLGYKEMFTNIKGIAMHGRGPRGVSRRTLLMGVAGGVGVFGLMTETAFATDRSPMTESGPPQPDEFLREMPTVGVTDLESVHVEYLEAVEAFPFPLPPGFTFPEHSRLENTLPDVMPNDVPVLWRRGSGYAEVFMYWQSAMATAVVDAHSRGDQAEAIRLLDSLEDGYSSSVRRAVLEDPDNAFIKNHVTPARDGDFSFLESYCLA